MGIGKKLATAYYELIAATPNAESQISKQIVPAAQKSGEKAGSSMGGGLGQKMLGAVKKFAAPVTAALSVAGITKFAKSSVDAFNNTAASVNSLKRIIGGSAAEVSELSGAMRLAGMDTGKAGASLTIFSKKLSATNGDAKATASMQKLLGTTIKDTHGNMKSMSVLLPQVADKFKNMADGPQKTALAIQLFGKSGTAMLPFLNKGSAGISELEKKAKSLGITLDDNSIKKWGNYRAALRGTQVAFDGLKIQLGQALIPIFTGLSNFITNTVSPAFSQFIKWLQNPAVGEFTEQIGKMIADMGTQLGGFIEQAMPILQQLGQYLVKLFQQVWPPLQQMIKEIIPPLMAAIKALLPVVMSIAQAVLTAVVPIVMDLVGLFKGFITTLTGIINFIRGVFTGDWKLAWEGIKQIFTGIWDAVKSTIIAFWHAVQGIFNTAVTAIKGIFGNMWNSLARTLGPFFNNIGNGIRHGWDNIINFFRSLPGNIVRAFGDAGKILYNIGKSIITGLWNGMKWLWDNGPGKWINGLAGWIQGHKGPIEYDRTLLVKNGQAIIGGLDTGMEDTFDQQVKPHVLSYAGKIQTLFDSPALSAPSYQAGSMLGARITPANSPVSVTQNISTQDPRLAAEAAMRRLTFSL